MASTGERAFAWAKACGIIGKSFLGKGIQRLYPITRLSELDRALFPANPLDLPERELSVALERRIAERASAHVLSIMDAFSQPSAALATLVRSWETADLKACLAAISAGQKARPPITDIGAYRTVNFDAFPDIAGMTAGTDHAWLAGAHGEKSLVDLETELDLRYYRTLWSDLASLPKSDRHGFQSLIAEEITLKNIVWTLRLRVYYKLDGPELDSRLVNLERKGISLAKAARDTNGFALDKREDWKDWKHPYLLNPEKPGEYWRLDPRFAQNSAARRLYSHAKSLFRRNPFSSDTIACFIKLMQFEEDILTSVAEGLALGIPAREALASIEVFS